MGLRGLWKAYQRRIDLTVLWPAFRREAARMGRPIEEARLAFRLHAAIDPAWNNLPDEKIEQIVSQLS